MRANNRGRRRHTSFPSAPSATRFLRGTAFVGFLAVMASILPGVPAAQAQTLGTVRLEVATVNGGVVYHKWSDDSGASWSLWSDISPNAYGTFSATGTPALISDAYGRLNAFALSLSNPSDPSSYNGIWSNGSSPDINFSWSGWTQVPGQDPVTGRICITTNECFVPTSSPAVSANEIAYGVPQRMDLFVIANIVIGSGPNGAPNALLHTSSVNGSWSGTWDLVTWGPFPVQPVGVASSGPGRIDLFATTTDSSLWHRPYFNGAWQGWEPLGGILTSPPVAASMGSGLVTVFTRGTDMNLYSDNFAGGWAGWAAPPTPCCLAGDVTNSVAVTSRAPGTLDVFVIGTQHDLYRRAYSAGGWAAWQYLDHVFDYTNIAATAWTPVAAPPPPPLPPPPPPPPPPRCGGSTGRPCPLPP